MSTKALDKMYDEISASFGFGKDEEGGWVIKGPGGDIPLTIKGKQVITPTAEVLKQADWDRYQPFHPLCENIRRKKSPVMEKIQAYASNRLKTVLVEIIATMTEIAVNSDGHDKLTADQREFLTIFEKANEKTLKNFSTLFQKVLTSSPGEAELIAIGVRRGGSWKGEEYARLTTISFPIMDEEFAESGKVFGTNITVRDKEILYKVLRYVLPKIDDPEAYCYGTRSEIAPMFHSLMMAYHSVAVDLNRVTKLIGGIDKDFLKRNLIVTTWSAQMPTLFEYKDVIPVLDGNDGEPQQDDVDKERRNQERRDERKARDDRSNSRRPVSSSSPRGGNPFTMGRRREEDEDDDRRSTRSRRDRDDRDSRRGRDRDRDDRRGSDNPFLSGGRGRDRDEDDDYYEDDRRSRRSSRGRGRDRDRDDDYEDDRRGRRRGEPDRDENGVTIGNGRRSSSRYDDDYDDDDDYYDDRRYSRRGRR